MADFTAAIYEMEQGKTVIRPNWGKGNDVGYILHMNKITTVLLKDGSIPKGGEGQIPLSITDYKADNWEIYKAKTLLDEIFTINCSPENIKIGSQWFEPEAVNRYLMSFYDDVKKECEANALGAGLGYLGVLRLMKTHLGDALCVEDEA